MAREKLWRSRALIDGEGSVVLPSLLGSVVLPSPFGESEARGAKPTEGEGRFMERARDKFMLTMPAQRAWRAI